MYVHICVHIHVCVYMGVYTHNTHTYVYKNKAKYVINSFLFLNRVFLSASSVLGVQIIGHIESTKHEVCNVNIQLGQCSSVMAILSLSLSTHLLKGPNY